MTAPEDGVWLVIIQDGQRHELPIDLPRLGGDEAAAHIRGLNAKHLWSQALAEGDMTTDPVDAFLDIIASTFE